MNIARIAAALAAALLLAACSRGLYIPIHLDNIMGSVDVSAENGTAGGPVKVSGPAQAPLTSHRREKLPSWGEGFVLNGRAMLLRAHAEQGKPAAAGVKAETTVSTSSTSTFTLNKGRDVDFSFEGSWSASLHDGHALITVTATIDSCTISGTFDLVNDAGNPGFLKITRGGTATTSSPSMKNDGHISGDVPTASCTLAAGQHDVAWSVSLVVTGDRRANVSIDSAHLVLH